MGYEVKVVYRDRDSLDDELKSKEFVIGKSYEDVPQSVVAGKIMSQLANQKREIVDVEIYEYTKKKLSFKFSDDGIVIKNKKYTFDQGVVDLGETDESDNDLTKLMALIKSNPELLSNLGNPQISAAAAPVVAPPKNDVTTPKKYEFFNPRDPRAVHLYKGRLKVGGKYPIYEENRDSNGNMRSTVVDDKGNRAVVPTEFFDSAPITKNNKGGDYSPKLMYDDLESDSITLR